MSKRRRTPLQRAETRHAAEPDQDTDGFRNMMHRRQDAEEKLRKHLEGERDGRPIRSEAPTPDAPAADHGPSAETPAEGEPR